MEKSLKTVSVSALVCGILGIVGFVIPLIQYFTFILAILGIVLGIRGRKLAAGEKAPLATAGLALGILGVLLGILGFAGILAIYGLISAGGSVPGI